MKQIYIIITLFLTIFLTTKAYNLRNTNQMESRIESNYSNYSIAPEQSEDNSQENDQSQIKKLKAIIKDLVNKIFNKKQNLR